MREMEAKSQVQDCSALTGADQTVDLLPYNFRNPHYRHTELSHVSLDFYASFWEVLMLHRWLKNIQHCHFYYKIIEDHITHLLQVLAL